jgi:hypothetical protein
MIHRKFLTLWIRVPFAANRAFLECFQRLVEPDSQAAAML